MIICCTDKSNCCDDFSCDVQKTDKGITISLTSDDKEQVEKLHKMSAKAISCCCDDSKDSEKCC